MDSWNAVMEEYREQREKNAREESRRKHEVFSAHPDIAALCDKRMQLVTDGIRGMLTGNASDPDIPAIMQQYNQDIRKKIASYGYPEEYLEPVYRCGICRDTGFVGEPVRERCACLRKALAEKCGQNGSEEAGFEYSNPDIFPDTPLPGQSVTQRKYMNLVIGKCREYAEQYRSGPVRNLLLHGESGLGKTYLLQCIAKRVRERGIDAVYVTAYQLLDDLRTEYFRPGTRDTGRYFDCGLLLIDDLGMEPLFDNITVEVVFNVFNERNSRNLGTAISTNLNRIQLKERYTERFISRLLDRRNALDLPLYGQDLRLAVRN